MFVGNNFAGRYCKHSEFVAERQVTASEGGRNDRDNSSTVGR